METLAIACVSAPLCLGQSLGSFLLALRRLITDNPRPRRPAFTVRAVIVRRKRSRDMAVSPEAKAERRSQRSMAVSPDANTSVSSLLNLSRLAER